ncbi:MAG: YmdB family metallophosphoesterase [Ruminococcaceae bacterium]|nr:YmdB family metallophosphoesterase [Oscillospiraceae bacterium]
MKILAIGDIVGSAAVAYLNKNLWKKRDELGVELVVANGENASEIHGVSAALAEDIFAAGVDVITLGNHSFGKRDICNLLNDSNAIIRPANYPPFVPGSGSTIINACGWRVLCMNVLGTALMEPMSCPFETVDKLLAREKGNYDISILDIHAESTSEKIALARYFDGRIDIIFGTHTHVATADEQILQGGTGYITDLGMSGPVNGVIGADAAAVIERMRTKIPTYFKIADGEVRVCGAVFDYDTDKRCVTSVKRITF